MDSVDIRLRLREARRFSADARRGARDIDRIGDAADRTKRDAREATGALRGLRTSAGRGLKSLVGVAVGYAGIAAAKDAVTTTVDLAKGTIALSRNLGFSTREASRWAAVAKARGVDTDALSTSFTALSKNVDAANSGSQEALDTFDRLGISQADLKRGSHDFQFLIGKVAEGLGDMEGGAGRAALAQKLLGRSSQNTLPIFTAGRKSLDENLKLADKYGVTLGDKPIKSLKELVKAQKEAEFAGLGLKVAFATTLAPTLTKALDQMSGFVSDVRDEAGKDADFGELLSTGIEMAVPKIADAAGEAAPKAVAAFAKGWWAASPWGKLVTAGFLIHKMGGFSAAGGWAAKTFVKKLGARLSLKSVFRTAAVEGAATASSTAAGTMAGERAGSLGGALGKRRGRFTRFGSRVGKWMGLGLIATIPFIVDDFTDGFIRKSGLRIREWIRDEFGVSLGGTESDADWARRHHAQLIPRDIRRGPRGPRNPIGGGLPRLRGIPRLRPNPHTSSIRPLAGASLAGGDIWVESTLIMPNGDVIAKVTNKAVRREAASK